MDVGMIKIKRMYQTLVYCIAERYDYQLRQSMSGEKKNTLETETENQGPKQ